MDSDPKLISVLETLRERPRLPARRIADETLAILREAPGVGLTRSREIIKARAAVSDARTKLVDKKVGVILELGYLERVHEDLSSYLRHKYVNFLNNIKNAKSREALVERALSPIAKRVSEAESVKAVLEEVIKDYDSRAFGLRDVIASLQLGEREA